MDPGLPAPAQAAALPYRFGPDGRCEVMLVTSTRRGRWIIPKGNVEPPLTPALAAAGQAFEEAGVAGVVGPADIGGYRCAKLGDDGAYRLLPVRVFALAVETEAEDWPEWSRRRRGRERRWAHRE